MSELHILNVGRADCQVMLLDTQEGQRVIVIDAGSLYFQGREPLLEFLEARNIKTIDLAILTHLHQDHFGGFHQLIDRVRIQKIISPCGDLVFQENVYPIFGNPEFYREYHRIFQYLQKSGTELCLSNNCVGKSFTFGDHVLHCLYPQVNKPLMSVEYAKQLCEESLQGDDLLRVLERHKAACNDDSSIWYLESAGNPIALFAGDSPDESMRQCTSRLTRPAVQKLSHHGINSKYFSKETQKAISPEFLVVSVDRSYYNKEMQILVNSLSNSGSSKVHYTFQGDFIYQF